MAPSKRPAVAASKPPFVAARAQEVDERQQRRLAVIELAGPSATGPLTAAFEEQFVRSFNARKG